MKYSDSTLVDLRGKIDRQLAAKTKLAKAAPLSLAVTGIARDTTFLSKPCIAAHGVITGINRTTGNLIIQAPASTKEWRWDFVLVDTPENRELLADLAATINRAAALRAKIEKIGLRVSRASGNIAHEHYEERVSDLMRDYQRREEQAATAASAQAAGGQ